MHDHVPAKEGGGEIEIASFSSMRLNLHIFAAVSALQAKYDTFFCALKEYSTSQIVLVWLATGYAGVLEAF